MRQAALTGTTAEDVFAAEVRVAVPEQQVVERIKKVLKRAEGHPAG